MVWLVVAVALLAAAGLGGLWVSRRRSSRQAVDGWRHELYQAEQRRRQLVQAALQQMFDEAHRVVAESSRGSLDRHGRA